MYIILRTCRIGQSPRCCWCSRATGAKRTPRQRCRGLETRLRGQQRARAPPCCWCSWATGAACTPGRCCRWWGCRPRAAQPRSLCFASRPARSAVHRAREVHQMQCGGAHAHVGSGGPLHGHLLVMVHRRSGSCRKSSRNLTLNICCRTLSRVLFSLPVEASAEQSTVIAGGRKHCLQGRPDQQPDCGGQAGQARCMPGRGRASSRTANGR